jgi:hypothetical protein
MKLKGRWMIVAITLIAAIGVSGIIEALPHASETAGDILIDVSILAAVMALSVLAARRFRPGK